MVSPLHVIQLSGFGKAEKRLLAAKINKLGGTFDPQMELHHKCNVLVIKKPCRSEKFLCALATGTPIVKADYITDSYENNCWQNVENYVWRYRPSAEDGPVELFAAPYRVMSMGTSSQLKAFSKWTCAVVVQDSVSSAVYKRILVAGGARLVNITLDNVTSAKHVPMGLTHLITDDYHKGRSLNIIAGSSVHCVIADYMGDFLVNGKPPQPYHYVVPYSPVIDLTGSPVVSDSSLIQEQNKNETDSDIEIMSWSSPVKSHRSNCPLPKKEAGDCTQTDRLAARSLPQPSINRSLNGQLSSCSFKEERNPLPVMSSACHVLADHTTFSSTCQTSGVPIRCSSRSYLLDHSTTIPSIYDTMSVPTTFRSACHVSGGSTTFSSSYCNPSRLATLPVTSDVYGRPFSHSSLGIPSGTLSTLPSTYHESGGPLILPSTHKVSGGLSTYSSTYHGSGGPSTTSPTFHMSGRPSTISPSLHMSGEPSIRSTTYQVSNGFNEDSCVIISQKSSEQKVDAFSTSLASKALSNHNHSGPFTSTPSKRFGNREDSSFPLNTKKYSKLLLLTPPKVVQRKSGSMGSSGSCTSAKVPRLDTQAEVPLEVAPVAGSSLTTPFKINPVILESRKEHSAFYSNQQQTILTAQECSIEQKLPNQAKASTVTVTNVERKLTEPTHVVGERPADTSFIESKPQCRQETQHSNMTRKFSTGSSITVEKNPEQILNRAYKHTGKSSRVAVTSKQADSGSDFSADREQQVLADQSCLGLLKSLTKRLSLAERNALYEKHEQLTCTSTVSIDDEELEFTGEPQEEELQELPVLLQKQICTYFEDEYGHENLSGLELLNLCTSRMHYPQAQLLKQIYDRLLTSTDPVAVHSLHDYLASRLILNPSNKRLREDVAVSPSRLCHTRRMRLIYMSSLSQVEYFQKTYFKYLRTAVQTIMEGGLSLKSLSQVQTNENSEEEEEGEEDGKYHPDVFQPDVESCVDLQKSASTDRDGSLGSILFIGFLHDLLVKDYHTAAGKKQSMLYKICQGNVSQVNLVDSKDCKCLLDISERVLDKGEMELAHKLFKLIGLLGELCRSDDQMEMNHSLAYVVRHISQLIKGCDMKSIEDILIGCLPSWLACYVVKDILSDHSIYSNQLIHPLAESYPQPSLQFLISNYFFLIPSKSKVENRSVSNSSNCHPSHPATKQKRNHKGETPLHTACIRGDLAKVKQLLRDGETNVNTPDNAGWTALHEACFHKHEDIVELLLTHKSSGFHFDGGGEVDMLAAAGDHAFTPLHDAVNVGSVAIVKLLLKHGDRKKLLAAKSNLGTVLDIADGEILELLKNSLCPVEGNENNNSAATQEANLRIAAPRSEIYHTHRCQTDGDVVERYVSYCCLLFSFHLASFPVSPFDKEILNSLSPHLEHFARHIKWLSSDTDELPAAILDRLHTVLLLSL
ncbi:uncharacterized protein [Watersipora subatra]|uniref:uncharacterized protein n=1 Tax=Watersipora subatra TaxID=2589382 RepID=UPI00355BD05B